MTTKPRVLLDPALPGFLREPLSAVYETLPRPCSESDQPCVRAMVLPGSAGVSEAELDAHPALEIIAMFAVGYDGIPLDACRARGIRVTNTPDVLTEDVADTALALTLMTSRELAAADKFVRKGRWLNEAFPLTRSVNGKRVGIVGLGRIGKAIAHRLEACGMRIAYHGRHAQPDVSFEYFDSLTEMAKASDFLVAACPGGAETRHLINAAVLDALGPEGTLINISRGSVVDETALVEAIHSQTLGGAGLDVFEDEPRVPEALIESDRVVLLPHVGSATQETRGEMARLCLENLAAHFSGEPLKTPVC